MAEDSSLYGSSSWCSNGDASSLQYLQFDFGKVVTVSGIATQGDAGDDKWVTAYAVRYGYNEQSWLDYAGGQHLSGNSDKSSVVVRMFSSPFAAQFVRILPKIYHTAQCMRVDLFGCRDFQVAFLYVNVKNATLEAAHHASVRLNCTTKSSKQQPLAIVYEWKKDGVKLAHKSSSSLTITYRNASDTNNKYRCVSLSSPSRDVQCTAVYQCSASLVTVAGLPEIKNQGNSTVTVILKKPGQVTGVSKTMVTARTAVVTWNYSPGENEAPIISITLRYHNSTSSYLATLSGSSSRKKLINLKPFSKYNVSVVVSSVLGNGLWSNAVTFETLTSTPEITIQVDNTTGVTSQSIYVEWKEPNVEKLNGPFAQYTIAYRESGKAEMLANVTNIDTTFHTITNLKKWTLYFIKVRVENRKHAGPWSVNRSAKTQQDAPGTTIQVDNTTGVTSQSIYVKWKKPNVEKLNGPFAQYTIAYGESGKAEMLANVTNIDTTFLTITNLKKWTLYFIKVRVENRKHAGPWSVNQSAKTQQDAPSAPQNLNLTFIKPSQNTRPRMRVTWNAPAEENGIITKYTLTYSYNFGGVRNSTEVSTSNQTFEYTFDVLGGIEYHVSVYAKTIKTGPKEEKVESVPVYIPGTTIQVDNTTGVTSQSIYVKWKKPNVEKLNGPFAQYTIAYRESGKVEMLANVTSINTTCHTISNLKKWTLYFIKVRVENLAHAGPWSVDRDAKTQQDAPSAPQNLDLTFIKPTQNTRPQIRVTWREPAEENGIITKYTLTYSYNFSGASNSTEVSKNGHTLEYTFDVLGGLEYTVSIYATTIKPGPNETQVGSVPVYKPSTAPFKIASQSYNETTYNISWDRLTREKSNGVVLAYEVNYSRVFYRGSPSSSAPRYQNTTNTMVTLQGLIACSTYHVLVRAYTSAGAGLFSPPLEIVTKAPGPPRDVKASTPGKRSITLTWIKPLSYGDDVQMYTVIFEGTKNYYPEFKDTKSVETKTLSKEITGLYPDTKYTFVVVATTHCGKGVNSTMVTERTIVDAPPAPKIPGGPQKIENAGSSVNLTVWAATQDNGPISYYQILVHQVQVWNDTVTDWNDFGSNFYICAQIPASDVKIEMIFLLGDGGNKGGYNNTKLSSGQKYKIYSRALTEVTSKKRSTDKRFLIGQAQLLAQVQVEADETRGGNQKDKKDEGSSSNGGVVGTVVPVVVVLVLIVGAIAGVIFWRRRRGSIDRSSKGSESHPMTDVSVNDAYDTIRPDNEDSQPKTRKGAERGEPVGGTAEPIYGNVEVEDTEGKPKPIPVSQFSEYVTQMRREKNAGFAKQYKLLASGQQFPWENAMKPVNKNKNRYANIIPYDHSRVILPLVDGAENSDYVNASYLHGYDSTPNAYIACQGPVPGTYQDFWRMLWQENVTTVVMLTGLVEHGRTKCHQYWPDKAETYLDITVTNHKTETIADYAIRTFILQKKGTQERRQVQQFHFLVWPDKGVPRHATAVLALRRKVRTSHNSNNKNPLVVHCSAGVGRTGAFIVIDAMLESIEKKKVADVFNYVKLLRVNRISMVQTEEQYAFIHMALLESVICGNTEIPAQDLRIALKKLVAVNPKTDMTGLAREYQRLDLITADDVTDIKDSVGRQKENASKNRFPDIVPLNGSRVILQDANNDYINASYVDTFRERNSFIMTQAPLENTIEDFWKMIWDYNIGTIVMLNEQKEGDQVYPMYWATEGSATFGGFTVETTSHEIFQDFSQREFSVAKKEDPQTVHEVHHYQITDWPDKGIPKNAQCILDMISMVEQSQRKTSNAPLVVQCSDGVGRSGTFCAILSVIERLKSEQVIDVCRSVKVIRVNRPKAVNCKAQYVFCYNLVQSYLDSFNEYANFN